MNHAHTTPTERRQPTNNSTPMRATAAPATKHVPAHDRLTRDVQVVLDAIIENANSILTEKPDFPKTPQSLEDRILVLDNGTLLVTPTGIQQPEFDSYLNRIKKLNTLKITSQKKVPDVAIHYVKQKLARADGEDEALSTMEAVESEKLFGELIKIAANNGSSDIHFVVYGTKVSTRFRINGRMQTIPFKAMSRSRGLEFMAAIYGMSNSKSEFNPRRNQGANVSIDKIQGDGLREALKAYASVRLNFLPVDSGGIDMVIRLNLRHVPIKSFTEIGFNERQAEQLDRITDAPDGYYVIGGPVNSGKSRTVAALMQMRGDRNTNADGDRETVQLSLEDPPEIFVDGVLPLDVMSEEETEEASDKKMLEVMRGINRSDYDDAVLGEVRDGVMAQRVTEISMSGRFIATSIHAPNAMMIFNRLEQLLTRYRGIGASFEDLYEKTNVAGIMSQRLLPKVCPHCCKTINTLEDTPENLALKKRLLSFITITDDIHLAFRGPGCGSCSNGFSGRVLVAEIIRPDQTFLDLMRAKNTKEARRHWLSVLNGRPMINHAIEKMKQGLIDPREVEKVFSYFDEITDINSIDQNQDGGI